MATHQEQTFRGELDHAWSVFQSGDLREATRLYEAIVAEDPTQHEAFHCLGLIAIQRRGIADGVRLIGRAIALNPASARYHNNLAYGLRALQRHADALASSERAIGLQPDFANAHYVNGLVLVDLQRTPEALSSFDAAIALRPDFTDAHIQRAAGLLTLGRARDALASAERALQLNPRAAEAWIPRGDALAELGQDIAALDSYDTAIRVAPGNPRTHLARGTALYRARRLADALEAYTTAISLQPDFALAHSNRANILAALGRHAEALTEFATALALKPDFAEAWNNRGVVLVELGRHHEALMSYARAIALKPDYSEPKFNLGTALLQLGQFEHGWFFYEWRKRTADPVGADVFAQPLWLGQPDIAGETILLHYEQGFGDTLQFCRFVPLVERRGARVILGVQRELRTLLQQLSPTITVVTDGDRLPAFAWHCPLASLPLALGTTLETIPPAPYLVAPPEAVRRWSARLPATSGLRVGIAWRGYRGHRNDHRRSIPLTELAPLLSIEADLVCLQKDVSESERDTLKDMAGVQIVSDELTDFAETAAVISCLDLVIAADTSVAHLAGAMGKPVWILLPPNPDWRWMLERHDSPWYPSARLLRHGTTASWTDVVMTTSTELRALRAHALTTRC